MRRYILRNQPERLHEFDWKSRHYSERKVFDILTGLALGILADGEISQKEAQFLAKWLDCNSQNIPEHFLRNLLPVIHFAGEGVDIPQADLDEITKILVSIAFGEIAPDGNGLPDSPSAIGTPSILVFDDISFSEIIFEGMEFIFTGSFSTCDKKELMERTGLRGAIAKSAVPNRNTDYVVVGSQGSDRWAYSGLGRKIEQALKLKEAYYKPLIIKEEVLVLALSDNPQLTDPP